MTETYRAIIPYESLDPLTIGASGDDEKVNRDQLELEIPAANLLAAIYPDEPAPVANATEAARDGARVAGRRALASRSFSPRRRASPIVIDNQFRPTPQSKLLPAVFDALEAAGITDACVICANGKVFPMSESDIEQKIGDREPRPDGAAAGFRSSRTSLATPRRTPTSASPRAGRRSGSTPRSPSAT